MAAIETLITILAFVIAVVALVVALAQLLLSYIFSYIFSKISRSKVNRAAIGTWAELTRGPVTLAVLLSPCRRARIQYVQPRLSIDALVANIQSHDNSIARQLHRKLPDNIIIGVRISGAEGARGRQRTTREFGVYRRSDHQDITEQYEGVVRRANQQLSASRQRLQWVQTKATWNNLMSDLVVDTKHLHPDPSDYVYIDSESIPSALDAPVIYVHASDIVLCGFLLDMDLQACDQSRHTYDMVGDFCAITFRQIGTSIPTVSYSSQPGYQHHVQSLTSQEARTLVTTARGSITIGDISVPWRYLGFNAAHFIFSTVLNSLNHRAWHAPSLSTLANIEDRLETDAHQIWEGKWHSPQTAFTPFVLAVSSNLAVSNAFPKRLLKDWALPNRRTCSKMAWQAVDNTCRFAVSVPDLINRMRGNFDAGHKSTTSQSNQTQGNVDMQQDSQNAPPMPRVMSFSDSYKIKDNYGSEHGGRTGWLTSTSAEFTRRASFYWKNAGPSDGLRVSSKPVPILSQLSSHLRDGTLREWALSYLKDDDRGEYRRTKPDNILWLQIMLIDSWVGMQVEFIMGGGGHDKPVMTGQEEQLRDLDARLSAGSDPHELAELGRNQPTERLKPSEVRPLPPPDEVCVPVDTETADRYCQHFSNKISTTGWKYGRTEFAQAYLERLADGSAMGVNNEVRSPSCMAATSDNPGTNAEGGLNGWEGMHKGAPEQWKAVDAVLSLRAVVMAERFELMKDSSVMLDFRERDPVLQMI